MSVEIFCAHVVVVGLSARNRVADHVVAIGIPLIKVIAARSLADLVLFVRASALNGNELAGRHTRATLWSRYGYFAFANENFRVIVGSNQNSKAGFAALRLDSNVWRIDFSVRIAVSENGIVRHTMSKLNLDLRTRELHDIGLRMLREPEHVGIVKLNFRSRLVASRNTVTGKDRSVQRSRGPVFRITTLRRDITVN
jgi:hypothetical protein